MLHHAADAYSARIDVVQTRLVQKHLDAHIANEFGRGKSIVEPFYVAEWASVGQFEVTKSIFDDLEGGRLYCVEYSHFTRKLWIVVDVDKNQPLPFDT